MQYVTISDMKHPITIYFLAINEIEEESGSISYHCLIPLGAIKKSIESIISIYEMRKKIQLSFITTKIDDSINHELISSDIDLSGLFYSLMSSILVSIFTALSEIIKNLDKRLPYFELSLLPCQLFFLFRTNYCYIDLSLSFDQSQHSNFEAKPPITMKSLKKNERQGQWGAGSLLD